MSKSIKIQFKKNNMIFWLGLIILSLISFSTMMLHVTDDSLWLDEIITVGSRVKGFPLMTGFVCFSFMGFLVDVLPVDQRLYLLPMIIIVVISVFLIGMIGKEIGDSRIGLLAAVLLGFSKYTYKQIAYEFRNYAFLLLFEIVVLAAWVIIEKKSLYYKISANIALGCFLLLLTDSHEYGKVLALYWALVILCKNILERRKIISYVPVLFPLLYMIYWMKNNGFGGMWTTYNVGTKPSVTIVYETFLLLCGSPWCVFLFFVGFIVALRQLRIDRIRDKVSIYFDEYFVMDGAIIFVFGSGIFYSLFIRPENSLYVHRYFVSVMAYVLLLAAYGICWIYDSTMKDGKKWVLFFIAFSMFCYFSQIKKLSDNPYMEKSPYKEAAEWLRDQDDVYNENTAICLMYEDFILEREAAGWYYFYFTEGGKYDSANIIYSLTETEKYDRVYYFWPYTGIDSQYCDTIAEERDIVEQKDDIDIVIAEKRKK